MAYNRVNYLKRVAAIQAEAIKHYEPENSKRNWKSVWRNHIHPKYAIGYERFIAILAINTNQEMRQEQTKRDQKKI